jgi:hypothetical protein
MKDKMPSLLQNQKSCITTLKVNALQHICRPREPTLKTKACKRAAILNTHPC